MNPPFHTDLIDAVKHVGRGWISWFTFATGGGKPITVTPGGSPFVYQNTTIFRVQAVVTGGSVSALQYSRDSSTYFTFTGTIVLYPGDYLKITYTGNPTLTVFPI